MNRAQAILAACRAYPGGATFDQVVADVPAGLFTAAKHARTVGTALRLHVRGRRVRRLGRFPAYRYLAEPLAVKPAKVKAAPKPKAAKPAKPAPALKPPRPAKVAKVKPAKPAKAAKPAPLLRALPTPPKPAADSPHRARVCALPTRSRRHSMAATELAADVAAFQAGGGVIERLPIGACSRPLTHGPGARGLNDQAWALRQDLRAGAGLPTESDETRRA